MHIGARRFARVLRTGSGNTFFGFVNTDLSRSTSGFITRASSVGKNGEAVSGIFANGFIKDAIVRIGLSIRTTNGLVDLSTHVGAVTFASVLRTRSSDALFGFVYTDFIGSTNSFVTGASTFANLLKVFGGIFTSSFREETRVGVGLSIRTTNGLVNLRTELGTWGFGGKSRGSNTAELRTDGVGSTLSGSVSALSGSRTNDSVASSFRRRHASNLRTRSSDALFGLSNTDI